MCVSDVFRPSCLCWIAVSLALSACSTMADIIKHKDEGTAEVYDVSPDQAWEIAKVVFRREEADAIEEHKDHGYMLTSSGRNLYSYGAVMGRGLSQAAGTERRSRYFPSVASRLPCLQP